MKDIPAQAMKANMDVEVSLQSFLTSDRDMTELTSRPGRLIPGKESPVPTEYEVDGPHSHSGC